MTQSDVDLLFSLPSTLSFEVVNTWLCLVDVVKLDSAFCHRMRRPDLLNDIFRSAQHSVRGLSLAYYSHIVNANEFLHRGIRMQVFLLTDDVDLLVGRLYLQRFGKFVKRVVMKNVSSPLQAPTEALCLLAMYCTNIRSLECEYCTLSDALVDVFYRCKELRSIRFEGCNEDAWSEDSDIYCLEGLNYCHLNAIDIDSFNNSVMTITTTAVQLLNDPPCVQRLSLRNAAPLVLYRIIDCIRQYTSLRALSLSQINLVSDAHLSLILASCASIKHLDISGCRSLTNASAEPIARGLARLRSLNIENSGLGDDMLHALAAHRADTLEELHCYCGGISSAGFEDVLRKCSKLHTVSLGNDIEHMLSTTTMSLLCHITTVYLQFHVSFTDEIFTSVIHHCKKLRQLFLCYQVSWCQLPLLELKNLPDLKVLSIWRDTNDNYDEFFTGVTDYVRAPPDYSDTELINELLVQRTNLTVRYEEKEILYHVMSKNL